jgi:hypothetical protein
VARLSPVRQWADCFASKRFSLRLGGVPLRGNHSSKTNQWQDRFPGVVNKSPELSEVTRITLEGDFDCDGQKCLGVESETPHLHLRITGLEPESGPRYEEIPLGSDEVER